MFKTNTALRSLKRQAPVTTMTTQGQLDIFLWAKITQILRYMATIWITSESRVYILSDYLE